MLYRIGGEVAGYFFFWLQSSESPSQNQTLKVNLKFGVQPLCLEFNHLHICAQRCRRSSWLVQYMGLLALFEYLEL